MLYSPPILLKYCPHHWPLPGLLAIHMTRHDCHYLKNYLLNLNEIKNLPEKNISQKSFRNFAFFEAYFSNYIEGTEFELDDAKKIIETNAPMPNRNEDSHDVLGTYKLVSNRNEMSITAGKPEELIKILLYRHKVLLSARTSKKPGQFKDKNNRAGETHFVDHTLVKGTLIKGFDFYQALTKSICKSNLHDVPYK